MIVYKDHQVWLSIIPLHTLTSDLNPIYTQHDTNNDISIAPQTVRIAAVQAQSVWLDLDGGVDKVCNIIKETGEKGVEVLGFPEVFIPGFPFQIHTPAPDEDFVLQYRKNSLVVGSPQYNKIRRAVRDAGVWIVVGFSERLGSTLFLAQSFINPSGDVVHHRGKLKPTHVERYLFGDGQEKSDHRCPQLLGAPSIASEMQRIQSRCSDACCVMALYFPNQRDVPHFSTSDMSGDVVTRFMAIEGGCFTMTCTAIISKEGSQTMRILSTLGGPAAVLTEGGDFSAIYSPNGRKVAQSKDQFSEELVIADVDLEEIHRHKQMADCIDTKELHTLDVEERRLMDSSCSSRPDLFSLNVTNTAMPLAKFSDGRHIPSVAERQLPLDE
ncbi:hypothetical protein LQV05_000480 [Cryptococcus neoformans]|nr:hypothetical protein LQV05_000480 [Cryptococcus neoformans]